METGTVKQTSILSYHDPVTQANMKSETERILEVFQKYPNRQLTAYDVRDLSGMDYYVIQKRLSILERKKRIRISGVEHLGRYQRTKYQLR